MKIAEVIAVFPPYRGGMGNACLEISKNLADNHNDVTVYTSSYPKQDYEYPRIIKVKRLKHIFKYGNAPLLPGLLAIKNMDIIHLHYPFFFGAELIYILSKIRGIPYVVTYHMDVVGNGVLKYIFKIYNYIFFSAIMRGAKEIYVTSDDYYNNSLLKNIKDIENKVHTVPLGVDCSKFFPKQRDAKLLKKYSIDNSDTVMAFVGKLDKAHYFKGVPNLIKAFSNLIKKDVKNIKLLIIGDGDLQIEYIKLVDDLKMTQDVIFTGGVDDLNDHLSLADILVLPSIDKSEAFGLVLVEAMAAGKCIVASSLPGVRTVLDDKKNGLLVKPNDINDLTLKLKQLIADESTIKQYGNYGLSKAISKYSWASIGKELSERMNSIKNKNLET